MWISKKMISAGQKKTLAEVATITGEKTAQGSGEYRGLPMAAPWGIAYLPPNSTEAVLVESNIGNACVGVLAEEKEIEPGELMLFSAGGAYIHLKNSGEIVINGQVFPAPEEE